MATITLEVELDGIENDKLDDIDGMVFKELEGLKGVNVCSVIETSRTEDDEEDEK